MASLRRHMETNVSGVLNVSRAFAPGLVANRGGLINVVALGSWLAHPAVVGAALDGLEAGHGEVLFDALSRQTKAGLSTSDPFYLKGV